MPTREKAVVVISGKFLQHFPQPELLLPLHIAIERCLSERDVIIVRSVVTIAPENSTFIGNCLAADFIAAPADESDLQAAAIAMKEATEHSINEVVLALGGVSPRHFLRLLPNKVRRVLLVNEPIDEDWVYPLDSVYEIRDLLSQVGVEMKPVVIPTEGAAASDFETTSVDEADDLCRTQPVDPYDFVKETANEWNQKLEEFIHDHEGICSADLALESLETDYPRIGQVFNDRRDDFRKLLDDNRVCLVEEDEQVCFCLPTNPAALRTGISNFGPSKASSINDVIKCADILIEECLWQVKRASLAESGESSKEILTEREENKYLASQFNLYLWPIGYSNLRPITSEDYAAMADRYELLKRALGLVEQVVEFRQVLGKRLSSSILQLAADVLCLIKSALFLLRVSPKDDYVQRDGYNFLLEAREELNLDFLENMIWENTLQLDSQKSIQERLDSLTEELKANIDKINAYEETFEELGNLCQTLANANPEDDLLLENWNKVDKLVTTLCLDYDEQPSSIRFRELFLNLVDSVPFDLVQSKHFVKVCNEIYLHIEREKEKSAKDPDFKEVKYSAEILAVRRHYPKGSKGVFVGGSPIPHMRERLEKKLGLQIIWEERAHSESLDRFTGQLNDPNVKVFLSFIPWCSHKHSQDLGDLARERGKDHIRLTKGTSPNTIAKAMCEQLHIDVDKALNDDE